MVVRKSLWVVVALLLALVASCRRSEPEQGASPSASAVASAAPALSAPPAPSPSPPAAQWTRPLLYKATTKGKPFYVFGTIHLPDSRLDQFPAELEAAFGESQAVFTEIPMDDATQAAVAPLLMLPPGKSLSTVLPAPLHARVSAVFAEQGLPFAPFEQMKPWAVSIQVTLVDRLLTLALKKPLDAVLYQRATTSGKEAGALETPAEQLAIFDGLKETEQVELLRQALDYRDETKKSKRDVLEEMLVAYIGGSDERLLSLMREEYDPQDPLSVKLMKRVFTDRNQAMTERILKRVGAAPERTYFFAVGAGHVVGDDGIAARLGKKGLQVARVAP